MAIDREETALLQAGRHINPHAVLGVHASREGRCIRVYRPGFAYCGVVIEGETHSMYPCGDGVFEYHFSEDIDPFSYCISDYQGRFAPDPYVFSPVIEKEAIAAFQQGALYDAYRFFGGRLRMHQGVKGASFVVWAPHAKGVSLIADGNHFRKWVNPMRKLEGGIWELFVPGMVSGEKYKFALHVSDGGVREKADPYALYSELRPHTASILSDPFKEKKQGLIKNIEGPINIYEMHLGSWQCEEGAFPRYREIAPKLAEYCREMGYTHVEVLPVSEHPLDESWGYQVTGYYAVTSRYGPPEDFQYFVEYMHAHSIGVLLDWVPAHFPQDDFSFALFDGTPLYEDPDPYRGYHPQWTTNIFDYSKPEVQNFLLSSALYYIEVMGVDGLRVDAVSSMLYLDYEREDGQWQPNAFGGNEHLEAIAFIKKANRVIHVRNPQALLIAEESHAYPKVTAAVEDGGLGFDLKWSLGWMNDTLRFFRRDYTYRRFELKHLYFTQIYMRKERYVLVLSHDEVVHGKGSLINKMPGEQWQQFASLRSLYAYMITFPGKKLLFMGGELAQRNEWHCKEPLQWELLDEPLHGQLHCFVQTLNKLYVREEALWGDALVHIDTSCSDRCVQAYARGDLLVVHNFHSIRQNECVVAYKGVPELLCSSDDAAYGGSGVGIALENKGGEVVCDLPPLTSIIVKIQ